MFVSDGARNEYFIEVKTYSAALNTDLVIGKKFETGVRTHLVENLYNGERVDSNK